MLKSSLSRPALHAAIVAVMVMLAGCSLKEISRMDRQASGNADTAQRINQSRTGLSQDPVTWTDKPWVNLRPVIPVVSSPEGDSIPDCQITINRPDGMTLPEIGQRITAVCGLRVTITPDALQTLVASGGGNLTDHPCGENFPRMGKGFSAQLQEKHHENHHFNFTEGVRCPGTFFNCAWAERQRLVH